MNEPSNIITLRIDSGRGVGPFIGSDFHMATKSKPDGNGTTRKGSKPDPDRIDAVDYFGIVAGEPGGRDVLIASARLRGRKVAWRDERREHIESSSHIDEHGIEHRLFMDWGPSWVLSIDPASWRVFEPLELPTGRPPTATTPLNQAGSGKPDT